MSRERLLTRVPEIYVAPDAESALDETRGILLGAQRPAWIDVMRFHCCRGMAFRELIARRFELAGPWTAVGVSLSRKEAEAISRWEQRLVEGLAPGDVVLAGREPFVHLGDRLAPAKLVRRSK